MAHTGGGSRACANGRAQPGYVCCERESGAVKKKQKTKPQPSPKSAVQVVPSAVGAGNTPILVLHTVAAATTQKNPTNPPNSPINALRHQWEKTSARHFCMGLSSPPSFFRAQGCVLPCARADRPWGHPQLPVSSSTRLILMQISLA